MINRSSLIFAITLYPSLVAAQEKVQSVCEILEHLDQFSGKLVSLKAKIQSDVDTWLAAESCKVGIRLEGIEFENLIAVAWPDSAIVQLKGPKVPFDVDEPSFRKLQSALGSTVSRTHSIYAQIEGLIVTRNPPLALIMKNMSGLNVRVGFGHLGMAAAEISVKLISAIDIVPRRETR